MDFFLLDLEKRVPELVEGIARFKGGVVGGFSLNLARQSKAIKVETAEMTINMRRIWLEN